MKNLKRFISKILILAMLITNLVSLLPSITFAKSDEVKETKSKIIKTDREKSEVIVKYKDDTNNSNNNNSQNSSKNDKMKADMKANVKGKLKLSKFDTVKEYKNQKIDIFEIDKDKDDIKKVIEELKKDPNVEYVQPNYKLNVSSAPLDEKFAKQWGLSNTAQSVEGHTGRSGVDINAINAWNQTTGSSGVVIGILDTGIDITHNDLKNNIFVNSGEIADNGIDDDKNGYIDDVNGWDFFNSDKTVFDDATKDYHGTHVAGIIGASTNSTGITGVAPNVQLLPLKFINGNYGYTCDAIEAIEYAMSMDVKIINCSFGGTDNNFALKDTMVNSGILFICAAGNSGNDVAMTPVYPACFDIPNVLSVASIDSKGVMSPYSSYGSKIQVAAPGANILSTVPNNNYDYLSGTSPAAPFVTGIAALLQSSIQNISITDIAARIKDNVVPCTNLAGKVSTGGRVDAFAALTNTKPTEDTYTGNGNDDTTVSAGQQGGNADTWYTLDQLSKIKEKLHYGEGGVNPASGNYSVTVNDMSVPAPGFQINISRSYNSKDDKNTPLSRGWTFGFEGKVSETDVVDVTLPTGGNQRFRLENGLYTAEDSRSVFVKNTDGTYLLTTKDQYKYTFTTATAATTVAYLTKMEDKNGNAVTITVDTTGKVTQITDAVGRIFTVNYNEQNLIANITDIENRKITYEYDSGLLARVIDAAGGIMKYYYDSLGYLNEIKDNNEKIIVQITYNKNEGENQYKVSQATDALGDTVNYTYDMLNRKTTITDMNGRTSTYWFDTSFYTIQVQDPEGKSTYTEYYQTDGRNKYGDVKAVTDRNGNKTQYNIDDRGNITKIINHDGSSKENVYDDQNNLIKQKDETNKNTYYVFDTNKKLLLKKAQPLNGIDEYTDGADQEKFAIISYQYYTQAEALAQFGCNANGLLKSVTDAQNNITTFTYDVDGNITKITDAEGKVTTNHYNRIGWKDYTLTPKGIRTEFTYNNNSFLEKVAITNGNGETSRTLYDVLGRKIQEILPNQYDPTKDDLAAHTYNDATAGFRYTYYDNGKLKDTTDPEGNITSYTYDVYGNKLTETRANASLLRYEYDVMDRVQKVYFKDNATEVLLEEYTYAILSDGKTQLTQTKYLNETEKAITVTLNDFAGRTVEKQNPDQTKTKTAYNPNGTVDNITTVNGSIAYFQYDGLNRQTESWAPFEVANGNTYYTYSTIVYDKASKKTAEKTGKEKVLLYALPTSYAEKNYTYYENGSLKTVTDAEGRNTAYTYDDDGNLSHEEASVTATSKSITDYEYNHLGKLTQKKTYVKQGDIYGYDYASTIDQDVKTSSTYDKNGNPVTITTPDNITSTYTYDNMNRQRTTSRPGIDETGAAVSINTEITYNWEGKPLTSKDANENISYFEYDARGLLTKTTNADTGVTAYQYDQAGRKTIEVSPKNYQFGLALNQMNRVEYVYDVMGRLKAKKDIYYDTKTSSWVTLVTKTYQYDNNGNVIKELDAVGYEAGSGTTLDEKISTGYGKEYTYNLAGKLETATDPVSKERALPYTVKYEYDGLGRKISETNAKGVKTSYTYDDGGNVINTKVKINTAEQTMSSATYDQIGRMLTQTDANGNTATFEYNGLNKLKKATYPGESTIPSNTVIMQYDILGNLKLKQDTAGKTDYYTYDNAGRVLSYTQQKADNTESITTTAKYDKNGNKRFETDGNQTQIENIYDALNRVTSTKATIEGVLKTTAFTYDKNGNQLTATDWLGNTSENLYDPLNRLIEKKDPYTTIQKLEYYTNNLQSSSFDALGKETSYHYDRNGRLLYTKDPEGNYTTQAYDDAGNIRSKADGNNLYTTYNYDELNRLKSVVNPKSETTSYTYDHNGNMLTQEDGNGNVTTFEYNVANKVTRKIDQGGRLGTAESYTYITAKTETYTYNADGSLNTKVDRNGESTLYAYDIHGRMTSQTIGGDTISYTYDNNGNQLTMTDTTGTTVRTYDDQNRVTAKTSPGIEGITNFAYDILEGNGSYSETTTDPKGNVTKKTYDQAGRLHYVIADGDTTTYEYFANGSRQSVTYPDGAKEEYTYYDNGLNKELENINAKGGKIDSYNYTYDAAHNQTSKTDSKGITNYIYDSLNRLAQTTEPTGRVTSYTFDKAGNRLTETVTAGSTVVTTTYTYNEQNRLMTTVTNSDTGAETTGYVYDNNGNMISKSVETVKPIDENAEAEFSLYKEGESTSTAVTFYEYDKWNQLTKTVTGEKTLTYTNNGDGIRVSKTVNGDVTKYLYEGDKVILEVDGVGSQTAKNVYGSNLLARTAEGETAYYMYNGHADVTALINATGAVLATYYYDEFGTQTETTGTMDNPYRYAGYVYDDETELYYLNARYYDSKIARFLQEDTFRGSATDPLSLNLYTYCANSPIIYTDPTGHAYYSYDIQYTWHPDNDVSSAFNIACDFIPFVGTTVKALGYQALTGDVNNDKLALDLTVDVASIFTFGLLKYGEMGWTAYKVTSAIDVSTNAYSYINKGVDFTSIANNYYDGIGTSKKISFDIEELNKEQIVEAVFKEASISRWLTANNKDTLSQRVEYVENYLDDMKENFNFYDLRKDFEGYYNQYGIFVNGYLQNNEDYKNPTKSYTLTSLNPTSHNYMDERTVTFGNGYINECWYDKVIYQSLSNNNYNLTKIEGYNYIYYYKNEKPVMSKLTNYIDDGKYFKITTTNYDNNGVMVSETIETAENSWYLAGESISYTPIDSTTPSTNSNNSGDGNNIPIYTSGYMYA